MVAEVVDMLGASTDQLDGPGTGDAEPDKKYDFTSSEELDDKAQELVAQDRIRVSLIATTNAPSLRIDGLCPRCFHEYTQTQGLGLPASTIRGAQLAGAAQTGAMPRWSDFLCDCDEGHPNTPSGARGCGANYTIFAP